MAPKNGAVPARASMAGHGRAGQEDVNEGTWDVCSGALRGVPAMDVLVRFERSWSIQDALDQHAALAEQHEVLAEIGRNRMRVRQTQLYFSEMEVEDAMEAVRHMCPGDAADAEHVLALAARVRAGVHNVGLAARFQQLEQKRVNETIAFAEKEIEKSRVEMAGLKEVIDDRALLVASDDINKNVAIMQTPGGDHLKQKYFYCTNCKVGGHGLRFAQYLLERPGWHVYPNQKWFQDENGNDYFCPLGKKMVDFADESHFSRIAMYLKGRAWLEEKTKVYALAPDLMPPTYIIEDQKWKGKEPPADDEVDNLPWFVKEADRNWGTSIHLCAKPSDCMGFANANATYVVQQHIKDPLLLEDGRKCHIKFYVLLVGLEDGVTWHLYTYQDGYLSISPNKWSPTDLSKETQVTIIRSERIGEWKPWPTAYPKCKAAVAKVINKAVHDGKLEGRRGKKQFEIFSSDFMLDEKGDVWFFEFNMSPVLKDPQDAPKVNDAEMIRGALAIVAPFDQGHPGAWDFAGEFKQEAPPPEEPEQTGNDGAAETSTP